MSQNKVRRSHGPMGGRMMSGEKAKDFKGTAKKLLRYMRKDLAVLIVAFLLAIGGVIATITVPDIMGNATDILMTGVIQKTVYNRVAPNMRFDESTLKMFDALGSTTIGYAKNIASIDPDELDEETTDPNLYQAVKNMTNEQRQAILGMPDEMNSVKFSQLAKAGREAKTIGEFVDILNMSAWLDKTLDSVPEAYRGAVREVSLSVAPKVDMDRIVDIMVKLMLLVVASGIMAYAQGFLLSGVSQKI